MNISRSLKVMLVALVVTALGLGASGTFAQSGTHTSLTRLYGWAPHNQRATGSVPRNHGKNTTLVVALTPEGLQVPWLIEGAMDTATFEWYISSGISRSS